MAKEIKFDIESRDALKRGVDALANAVKVTSVSYTHLDVYKRQPKNFGTINSLQEEDLLIRL